MAFRIEKPEGRRALTEFVLFRDRVYANRSARWPTYLPLDLPLACGEGPFAAGRRLRPFLARDRGQVVARVLAAVDERYIAHWKEPVGHILWFEALPGSREAVRALLDAACEWLAAEGMRAARAGFGLFEMPFVIDDYETLPPSIARHNPAYFHPLLKEGGFETEQGWVDYKIEVRPPLVARWESALEATRRAGYRIVPFTDLPDQERPAMFADLWNDTFSAHWGYTPTNAGEQRVLIDLFAPSGFLETAVVAYEGDVPVGVLTVVPETTSLATLAPGRVLADSEKLNFLGIGVCERARGRGLNLAMAAYAYLELARRGARWLSYTLVLDDNWPSRRTAEKLGATVCANYVVYRRELRG